MVETGDAAIIVERGQLQARQRSLAMVSTLGITLCSAAIAAGKVPASALAAWIALSVGALLLRLHASRLVAVASVPHAPAIDRLQRAGAAAGGLVAGAAGTLFLQMLDPPAQVALTLLACAGVFAVILDFGHQGLPFRLHAACCIGQFALAWWRLGDPGSELVSAALLGFWLLAGIAATAVDRLGRQVLAAAIQNRRLAESLAAEHARALAADRAKSHFIAAASHDLRQPAAALSLMTGLLRQRVTDPALAPTVRGLERSVQAMNDLLGQLLDLSRLDAGRIALEVCAVDVDELLDDVAREIAPAAADRGLVVRVEHCGHELDCDRLLTMRMLRNLADNALRHTGSGSITLGARVDERLTLSVTDTGSGIHPEHQARIFDEHYQVGNDSRQRNHGLGLGLAIVRRIAALHDVEIGVVSAPDQGSVFTLKFRSAGHRSLKAGESAQVDGSAPPDSTDHAPTTMTPIPSSDRQPTNDPRQLLLIEDDELLASAFLAWFREAGFRARRVRDGAQAIRVLDAATALDVVVSDFRLPGGLDGLALLGFAGDRHPHARRVLVTGDTDPALDERAAGSGVTLLRKPVDPAVLRRLLTTSVG
ncbi:MAG TPA: ATP-binding protein [Burkholderiaceae bacterium]|nr:ATP-binding protein [Burkholderiaceae bacterium]